MKNIMGDCESVKIRFGYLPGDFPNAFALWGTNCSTTAAHCNGDGDGIINLLAFVSHPEQDIQQEPYMAWLHLNLAGLVQGNFSGFGLPGNNWGSNIGFNIPASKYDGGGWYVTLSDPWMVNNVDSLLTRRQALLIGAIRPFSYVDYPLFNPVDASNIDSKIDDGKPYTGNVVSLKGIESTMSLWNCVNGSGTSATYDFTQTSPQCWMWFTYSDDK